MDGKDGRATVGIQGPKARSIPAWAKGPGHGGPDVGGPTARLIANMDMDEASADGTGRWPSDGMGADTWADGPG